MNSSYYDALSQRDPAFDGVFLYAVATTGVYCRPTCKSRRPLERNVRFFADPAAARAAGLTSHALARIIRIGAARGIYGCGAFSRRSSSDG